ncbi:MAG: hypothetical protein ABW022_00060 [Actinoplanes sp.]
MRRLARRATATAAAAAMAVTAAAAVASTAAQAAPAQRTVSGAVQGTGRLSYPDPAH